MGCWREAVVKALRCSRRKSSVWPFEYVGQLARRTHPCASVFVSPTMFGSRDTPPCRRLCAHIPATIACRAFHPKRLDRDYRQTAGNAPRCAPNLSFDWASKSSKHRRARSQSTAISGFSTSVLFKSLQCVVKTFIAARWLSLFWFRI